MIQTTTVLDETKTPRPRSARTRASGYANGNGTRNGNGAVPRPTRARQAITAASGLMLLFNLMGQ